MIDILMPRLSDTMKEGAISQWHKKPGEQVNAGDLLVEIETDKATMDQESYETGVLHEILVPEGEQATIGMVIARLDDGSGPALPATAGPPRSATVEASTGTPSASTPHAAIPADPGRLFATPLVRKVARETGIDLERITGTGPGGRIVRADLDDALTQSRTDSEARRATADGASSTSVEVRIPSENPPSPGARNSTAVPFTKTRRVISDRLTESSTSTPHFFVTAVADIDELLELRSALNTDLVPAGFPKISVNDLLVRASAIALQSHPGVNASFSPEGQGQTLLHRRINVGIAVASESGLVVPVIADANQKSVSLIASESRTLVARAKDRRLTTADMSHGTFTISNLGMYGVEHFTAIINPPEGAILAVGAGRPEPVVINGKVEVRTTLRYTLSADHRIIDGALAAQFLASLTELLEAPLRIIA